MEEAVLLAGVRRRWREEAAPPVMLAGVRRHRRDEAALLTGSRRAARTARRSEEAPEG